MSQKTSSPSWSMTVWKIAGRQASILMLLALFSTAILWAVRPDKLPLIADATYYKLELTAPLVNIPEALDFYEVGDHLFVDVRSDETANGNIIPGAFIIREASMDDDLAANMEFLFPEDKIIPYGSGDLMVPANIAARLQERGFSDLVILKGGLGAWTAAGGPVSQRIAPGQEEAL